MFTVIFYDSEMQKFLKEYMSFIQPLANQNNFALCRWNTAGMTINEAVPELYDIVGERKEWRAIVLHHLFCDASKNPYDVFTGEESAEDIEANDLIRFTHMLSTVPRKMEVNQSEVDMKEASYKFHKKVSCEIIEHDKGYGEGEDVKYFLECYRPIQVTLVTTRKIADGKNYFSQDKDNAADKHESLFWDRNDYPSNVRFVIYDLYARGNKVSRKDVFEFINAVLVLAVNDMFAIKLEAYKLYKMSVEIDKSVLEHMLENLQNEMYNISSQISKFRVLLAGHRVIEQMPGELPNLDEEYEIQFPEQDASDMVASRDGYGLAKDCPTSDIKNWHHSMKVSDEAFENFKKQPIRCLKRSINEYREMEKIKNKPVKGVFDEFQLEDLKTKMEQMERDMFDLEIGSSLDYAKEDKVRNSRKKAVETYMSIRMFKKEMILAGGFAILVFTAGFIPFLISTSKSAEAFLQAILIMVLSVAGLTLCGVVAMWIKYRGLIHLIADYNGQIMTIINQARINQERFKSYVSKAFNYRKYWFFIKEVEKGKDREVVERGIPTSRMLKLHALAVENCLDFIGKVSQIYEIDMHKYEEFSNEHKHNLQIAPEATGYYRLPLAKKKKEVEYNGTGKYVAVPYEYIVRFNMKKEELYDI